MEARNKEDESQRDAVKKKVRWRERIKEGKRDSVRMENWNQGRGIWRKKNRKKENSKVERYLPRG